jgi:hypothetical protein
VDTTRELQNRAAPPPSDARPPGPQEPWQQRHVHRERDFGIGYGNSSGYGSERHYVDGHADPIFRCV